MFDRMHLVALSEGDSTRHQKWNVKDMEKERKKIHIYLSRPSVLGSK